MLTLGKIKGKSLSKINWTNSSIIQMLSFRGPPKVLYKDFIAVFLITAGKFYNYGLTKLMIAQQLVLTFDCNHADRGDTSDLIFAVST